MAKPQWGSKQTCPKCSTRFYDLKKDTPVTCIACGHEWNPEPILKSKQTEIAARRKPVEPPQATEAAVADEEEKKGLPADKVTSSDAESPDAKANGGDAAAKSEAGKADDGAGEAAGKEKAAKSK